MAAAIPAVTSTAPGTSRPRSAAPACCRTGTASGIATSQRQPASEVSTPPRMTPRAEPTPASPDHTPSAFPRPGPVNSVMTVASAAGDISAAPRPCSDRPASSIAASPDTGGDPADALARLVAASWQLVHQFSNILLAAQRELPVERIRGVHDPILRRVQSLIERGQRAGTFRTDLPEHWLATTAFSLMHAAAQDAAAGRIEPGDAAG